MTNGHKKGKIMVMYQLDGKKTLDEIAADIQDKYGTPVAVLVPVGSKYESTLPTIEDAMVHEPCVQFVMEGEDVPIQK